VVGVALLLRLPLPAPARTAVDLRRLDVAPSTRAEDPVGDFRLHGSGPLAAVGEALHAVLPLVDRAEVVADVAELRLDPPRASAGYCPIAQASLSSEWMCCSAMWSPESQ